MYHASHKKRNVEQLIIALRKRTGDNRNNTLQRYAACRRDGRANTGAEDRSPHHVRH